MKLKGNIGLITGASRGIGRGIAEIFAEEGADVAVNYATSAAKAEEVAAWVRGEGPPSHDGQGRRRETGRSRGHVRQSLEGTRPYRHPGQ